MVVCGDCGSKEFPPTVPCDEGRTANGETGYAMRSLLFIPGNQPTMLRKAMTFRPDVYVPDMEDSVPESEKTNARLAIADHLERLATPGPLVVPRVNALDTGIAEDDLAAVVGPRIHGVSIGKVRSVGDIQTLSALLSSLERKAGIADGQTMLIPWIETASAVVRCADICESSPRILGVAFGAEDYAHDMGIERTENEDEMTFARSMICTAARAAGVLALDTPYFGFRDDAGLRRNALRGKALGFKGKFAIHPAQIETIAEVFAPSEADIGHARRVIAAFEEAESMGRGSTSLDGQVIDVPVVKRARAILAQSGDHG